MQTQSFTPTERQSLLAYLTDALAGMHLNPQVFRENLLETTEQPAFARALREWLNRKHPAYITDIKVNGNHLKEMLSRFEDKRFGMLFSLIPLYLERNDTAYRGIARLVGQRCFADVEAMQQGAALTFGYRMPEGWYLVGEQRGMLRAGAYKEICAPYDAWTIVMDAPYLIAPLLRESPIGSTLLMVEDAADRRICRLLPPESKGGVDV